MNLELVTWLDSVRHPDGWMTREDWAEKVEAEDMIHQTAGWVVYEDEACVGLAQSRKFGDGDVADVMQIPKGCVRARKIIATDMQCMSI